LIIVIVKNYRIFGSRHYAWKKIAKSVGGGQTIHLSLNPLQTASHTPPTNGLLTPYTAASRIKRTFKQTN